MSGICGIYSPDDTNLASSQLLNNMMDAAVHWGVAQRRTYDSQLIALTNLIPTHLRGSQSKNMGKHMLKLAFRDLLPAEIANRKKKGCPVTDAAQA
ncbi:asparagine synthase-related protein [bacterium]|nr:asparagine synthase-related protein [bacterium]